MLRQRVRSRTSPLVLIGRIIVALFSLALIWYGLMTLLLAFKVSPATVNSVSAYRTVYDKLAGLTSADVDGTRRAVIGVAGLAAFLICGLLALKQIPRPYLARHDLELHEDRDGTVTVAPRAIEHLAETAAKGHPSVSAATGRYGGDDLAVAVTVRRAHDVAAALTDVRSRVRQALGDHDLPVLTVDVTLTGFDRKTRRELR